MEHFEISRIFQRFSALMRRNFPTIFRQLSDSNLKSNAAVPGLDPPSFRITTCYSTTAPHKLYVLESLSAKFYPSPIYVLLCQHCVNSVYLRQCCVFLRQYSVHLRQYCVFLCQYCITLRQYCVLLCQYSVHLRQYCVFLRQYCVKLRKYCVFLR